MRALTLLTLASLTLAAPIAAAQDTNYLFGTIVGRGDYDYSPIPLALTVSPCFMDDDGDGAYDAGEPIYLDVDSATCAVGTENWDVRLTPSGTYAAGSLVATKDTDAGKPLAGPLNDDLLYWDADGDGEWSSKDVLYLDVVTPGGLTADVGDLRLTKAGALPPGATVKSSDDDASQTLAEVRTPAFDLMDTGVAYVLGGGTTMKSGRCLYLNMDNGVLINEAGAALGTSVDLAVESNDVRLTQTCANPFGLKAKDVAVLGAGFSPANPIAGQPFTVSVDTKNNGKSPGVGFVTTALDKAIVDARATPLLAGGESATLVMTLLAPRDAGAHTLTVGGVNYQVNVEAAPDAAASSAALAELQSQIAALETRLAAVESSSVARGKGTVSTASAERADAPALDVVAMLAVLWAAALLVRRRRAA